MVCERSIYSRDETFTPFHVYVSPLSPMLKQLCVDHLSKTRPNWSTNSHFWSVRDTCLSFTATDYLGNFKAEQFKSFIHLGPLENRIWRHIRGFFVLNLHATFRKLKMKGKLLRSICWSVHFVLN